VGARILVVDDEIEVAKSLRRVLRMAGFEVEIAIDGRSALANFDAFDPDLLITDFRMPVMNGAELVAEVGRRRPSLPCLVLSGYLGVSVSGCTCVNKPFGSRELVATVRGLLAPAIRLAT
jgi:DNA-binding response OmpR family regulator